MELAEGDRATLQLRRELAEAVAPEREAGAPEYLFGQPRLQRFLQGNENKVQEAAEHFRKMVEWRREAGMAERRKLVEGKPWDPDVVPGLRPLLQILSADVGSHTPDGDLIWVQCDGLARLDRLMEVTDEDLFSTLFLMCELRQDHLDRLSEKSGQLRQAIQVRDLAGLSVTGLLRNRAVMGRLQSVLKVVNVAYPETLRKLVLMNLPTGFGLLWAALKPLLNARIQQKFIFLGGEDPISQLHALAGNRCLEALVRARLTARGGGGSAASAGAVASELEVPAGSSEYSCLRMERGDLAEWSFRVGGGKGLRFAVQFYNDSAGSPSSTVLPPAVVASTASGTHRAMQSGLLWFTWSNLGAFSGSKRVEGLRVARGAASAAYVSHKAAAETGPRRRRGSEKQCRAQLLHCGCFGWPGSSNGTPSRGDGRSVSGSEADDLDALASARRLALPSGAPYSTVGMAEPSAQGSSTIFLVLAVLLLLLLLTLVPHLFRSFEEQITAAIAL